MTTRLLHAAVISLRKGEKGFTLLEYCAGAAVLLAIVYVGLSALGTSMQQFLTNIGGWLTQHGDFAG